MGREAAVAEHPLLERRQRRGQDAGVVAVGQVPEALVEGLVDGTWTGGHRDVGHRGVAAPWTDPQAVDAPLHRVDPAHVWLLSVGFVPVGPLARAAAGIGPPRTGVVAGARGYDHGTLASGR